MIKKSLLYFTNLLEQEGLINEGAIFIDGTKIEADANRYTFVWRKAVENYHEKLKDQAVELYDEQDDYYLDQNGVRFSFKYYSRGKDKTTGQVRYNPNWQYLKEKAKAVLQSPEGSHIYRMRKYDVEPIFGHLKNVFGMRRTHLRGKKKVETDVGIAFMMMNLSKYWNRRWSKDQFCLSEKKKTVKQLKLRVRLIVFLYLRVSFFPDTF